MEQNPPDRRSQHCCHAPPLASFSACDDQPGRPWRNSEYRVGGWICGHAQCSCLHCVEALSASIYRVSARSTCRHRSYRVGSRARGLWNLRSTKLLVSKAVRLQARHFPNHCARMHRRYCSGIRERFARNFSWPELSLADENAAPDATTTSRNSCRPSSSPDSLSGNQTRSLRSSPTGHVYAS